MAVFIFWLRFAFASYGETTSPLPGLHDRPALRKGKGHASDFANVVWLCPCHVPCYFAECESAIRHRLFVLNKNIDISEYVDVACFFSPPEVIFSLLRGYGVVLFE